MNKTEKWIAAAFGETGLRAWAMQGSQICAQTVVQGRADAAEQALAQLPDDWLTGAAETRILICGLRSAPLCPVPVSPAALQPVRLPVGDPRRTVLALPGLKQTAPPDILLGGETRIAGFLAKHAGWDGVICLPGLPSCWAHISAGEIVSFQTFLTAELFAAVAGLPPLSDATGMAELDTGAFTDSLDATLSRPEKLAAALSSLRARERLESPPASQSRAQLWGALIGAELAAARPYWLGQQVAIVAAAGPAGLYGAGLQRQGVPVIAADSDEMALAGLTAAWQRLP